MHGRWDEICINKHSSCFTCFIVGIKSYNKFYAGKILVISVEIIYEHLIDKVF